MRFEISGRLPIKDLFAVKTQLIDSLQEHFFLGAESYVEPQKEGGTPQLFFLDLDIQTATNEAARFAEGIKNAVAISRTYTP